jgi:acyl-CoA hydrolase
VDEHPGRQQRGVRARRNGHALLRRGGRPGRRAARAEVGVRVEAENPRTGEIRHTTTAYLTMVALDDDGRPMAVPALEPETDTERRRQGEAQLRRANRLAEREQIMRSREEEPSPSR